MLRKILKRDFKRKKAMNIILSIFLLTASVLIASSINLMFSTVTAVDYFIEKSEVADLNVVSNPGSDIEKAIADWVNSSAEIKHYTSEEGFMVENDMITASDDRKANNLGNLVIMKKSENYNLIFDTEGKSFEVGPSEAAIPVSVQKKLDIKVGDTLTIHMNGLEKDFNVTYIFKDVVYGSELMSLKRIILNEADFSYYAEAAQKDVKITFFGFAAKDGYDGRDLEKSFTNQVIPSNAIIPKDMIAMTYIFDMVLAIVLIIVSIFLILISFLILRFTIVFTVMEDYKQIGVMKAIGFQNSKIRRMYNIKYLMLSIITGIVGYVISIPVSHLMKKDIGQYILLNDSWIVWVLAFLSVVIVVLITVVFCNYTTGKIKKISAIDAIRQGNTGERFKNNRKLKLHQSMRWNTALFLAVSDIVSDFKKFVILIITFVLGTAIIIIPNNIISTLDSENTITYFGYAKSDFYIRDGFLGNQTDAVRRMEEIKRDLSENDFNVELRTDLITPGKAAKLDQSETVSILAFQGLGIDASNYEYLEGTPPSLRNEIAITEKTAKLLKVSIGDTIVCEVQGDTGEYIITALFQTFNNLGNAIRLSEKYVAKSGDNTSVQISGRFEEAEEEKRSEFNRLKDTYPQFNIKRGEEVVGTFIGNITQQLNGIKTLILILVLAVNFLITTLLLRMLVSKEVPEIAILKSIGFHSHTIRLWQIYRLGLILLFSIITGTILANSTGNIVAGGIFNIMGVTRLHMNIVPLQVYLIHPAILFGVTMTAVVSSLGIIKKTHVWEINNQE